MLECPNYRLESTMGMNRSFVFVTSSSRCRLLSDLRGLKKPHVFCQRPVIHGRAVPATLRGSLSPWYYPKRTKPTILSPQTSVGPLLRPLSQAVEHTNGMDPSVAHVQVQGVRRAIAANVRLIADKALHLQVSRYIRVCFDRLQRNMCSPRLISRLRMRSSTPPSA